MSALNYLVTVQQRFHADYANLVARFLDLLNHPINALGELVDVPILVDHLEHAGRGLVKGSHYRHDPQAVKQVHFFDDDCRAQESQVAEVRALDGVADDFVEQLDAVDGGDAVDVLIVEVDEVLLGLGADDQQEKRVDCEHN